MMIRVVYKDGEEQLVRPQVLDKLIANNGILKFERSDGWAVLGESSMRAKGVAHYPERDRRVPH